MKRSIILVCVFSCGGSLWVRGLSVFLSGGLLSCRIVRLIVICCLWLFLVIRLVRLVWVFWLVTGKYVVRGLGCVLGGSF